MLDAICTIDQANPKTYSIFEFKQLPEEQIDKLRYCLQCPVCQQKAYFRRASKDGKQACFGSRYHKADCEEFNPSLRKTEEQKQVSEIENFLLSEDALVIDFNSPLLSHNKVKKQVTNDPVNIENAKKKRITNTPINEEIGEIKAVKLAKQGLAKLLTSLLRGSSLATSDVWIYTSEKHKWRAKNLFVNIADAQATDNGAPRMYWGTISHADKAMMWLNLAEQKHCAIPISKYQQALLSRFNIESTDDFEGAGIILFGKCIESKDNKRKYIQLWSNDLQYLAISKVDH